MSARIRNLGIDCRDTYALAGSWAQVFDCPRQPEDVPGDPEAMLLPPGWPDVLFLADPEGDEFCVFGSAAERAAGT
ncbi:hypothetical protein [Micromonospora sp. KC723]|uniref:hypothetical protein n=1 Tax=Micromonospora sp. KC723 TaxID=2530381 RepID=UPI00104BB57E|nr:hypothetical protein [Micromonospora sp. KC723]TDB72746.1 hypothetical protein E1165_19325 [Micromonospora sp. KC723]